MKAFDAHCHLEHEAFEGDVDFVIDEARALGVERIHVPGFSPATWPRAGALSREGIVRGVGLHPWWVDAVTDADVDDGLARLSSMLAREDVCSVGEIGLDRARDRKRSIARQERAFLAQLELARAHALPIVLHVVSAHGRVLELLERASSTHSGLVHGFTGAPEIATRYVGLGLHVSFGPAITRTDARRARASAGAVPDARLLVETDAPDQAVEGRVGQRGEPSALGGVISALAVIRGQSPDDIAAIAYENASRLFMRSPRRGAATPGRC
jgi:TatD DNase family protein